MKTAIICDWLVTLAGAERILQEIIHCYPDADLFAVVDFVPEEKRGFLLNKPVTTTFIQKLPGAKKHYRSYLPLMPLAIEQLDLTGYDLIISSSHAVAKGVITGPDQLHISYIHSPMRYAWDLQHQYLRETGLDKGIKGFITRYLLHRLRLWDTRAANGVDHFIANSHYIARRVHKTYRRTAEVIAPPVNHLLFTPHHQKEDFYLTAARMVPYKKMDLIVESFAQLPDKKLIVIGDGPELAKVKAKATPNIEILGYQPSETLVHYMQRAKGFVFAAEEDFGIVLLEAQACGTPVIAFGKGGGLEAIRNIDQPEPTGLFFSQQTGEAIQDAIHQFEKHRAQFTVENCVNNAMRFTADVFRQKFTQQVEEKLSQFRLHAKLAS